MSRPTGGALAWSVVAVVGIVLAASVADAAPKKRIRIETDPAGATVYIGDKESGAAGVTPLEISLPAGENTVILERTGFLARFEVIQVQARPRRPQVVSFRLEPGVATLIIAGADVPAGARVFVDGEDRGAPPLRLEVEPGAHQVEISADGWRPFETWVEVGGGGEQTVEVAMVRLAVAPTDRARPAGPTPTVSGSPRQAHVSAGAGYQIGWRRFRYDQPVTSNAQPFDADGAGLVALWIELHPHRASRALRLLWPLSLVASYQHGLPLETDLLGDAVADATWRSADLGLRYRIGLGPFVAFDLDAGWARTLFTVADADGGEVEVVPDVDYQALRVGARLVAHLGPVDAWAGAENHIVLSGGRVEDRFRNAEVDGYGLRAGVEARWWRDRITTRVEASWHHYGWTFDSMAGDAFQAAAASDDLYGLLFAVGASL